MHGTVRASRPLPPPRGGTARSPEGKPSGLWLRGGVATLGPFGLRSWPGRSTKTMKRTVREVMAPDVIVAKRGDLLGGIREIMDAHDIHCLPIVDEDDQPIAMITSSDLLPGFSATMPVSRIMSPKVYTVTPDTDVETAAQMMREYRVHHIVVTDGNKVVGVLSSFDLLRLIAEH